MRKPLFCLLVVVTASLARADSPAQGMTIDKPAVVEVSRSGDAVTIAWEADLESRASEPLTVRLGVRLFDKSGEVVAQLFSQPYVVAVRQKIRARGTAIITAAEVARVVRDTMVVDVVTPTTPRT